MRFAIAGGGVAGMATALALARGGHSVVLVERDEPANWDPTAERPGAAGHGHPLAVLPRGRQTLRRLASEVLEALRAAGAHEDDLSARLRGPREAGDDALVYLWVRRPLLESALRQAVRDEPEVELRYGRAVQALLVDEGGCAGGFTLEDGERVLGDVVVDALGRSRAPARWPRPLPEEMDCGLAFYSRQFALAPGAALPEGPWLVAPQAELGYLSYQVLPGDSGTFAVTFTAAAGDAELRMLREERAFMAACAQVPVLSRLTGAAVARPITPVLAVQGLSNTLRLGPPGAGGLVAVGDAFCHTNPIYQYGATLCLIEAEALTAAAASEDPDTLAEAYRLAVEPEVCERYALACETDAARLRLMAGAALDIGHRDGCYPLFALTAAMAAAPHDDRVLRRTLARLGMLERTGSFDGDLELHARIEQIYAHLQRRPRSPAGPAREALLARIETPSPV